MSQPLHFPPLLRAELAPFLPPQRTTFLPEPSATQATPSPPQQEPTLPHVTLTYAQSLDSQISLQPGIQTILSGPETKAMTHYLRSCHDAILVGVGTAEADNPGLNSRFVDEGEGEGEGGEIAGFERQPRPFILDPSGRWRVEMSERVFRIAEEGLGRKPWWIVGEGRRGEVTGVGCVIECGEYSGEGVDWGVVLMGMAETGIRSVMVEGGAAVINDLLRERNQNYISSVVVTIAPTYLGQGGVVVSPPRTTVERNEARLRDVKWLPLGHDVVMAGRIGELV